jgi:3-isopropylmalate/(R)-2-methylmalate dehydratase small subunit
MTSQVTLIQGRGIPLSGNDIDTDRIIPARFLRCVTFDGLGSHIFQDDRTQLQGKHPFDLPEFQGARILVVNGNFGCGSSREHAPQALQRWGIRAIVGESFAEIFSGNCLALGMPCVTAAADQVQRLQAILLKDPSLELKMDLDLLEVRWPDHSMSVNLKDGIRSMFLSGTWDACGMLVANTSAIWATAGRLPYTQW